MIENLQVYALFAEILGALGIIASLIFVGIQVNREARETAFNTKVVSVNAYQNIVNQNVNSTFYLLDNPKLYALSSKIFQGEMPADEDEKRALGTFIGILTRQATLAFIQYQNQIIDEATLVDILGWHKRYIQSNFGKELWKNTVTIGNATDFHAYVNKTYFKTTEKANKQSLDQAPEESI